MAAVFPLDTSKPWTFNGVTYEYDASEDRWFVISTSKTDIVDTTLDALARGLDATNSVVDAIAASSGKLEFKGRYTYVLEKTTEACTAAYAQCLLQAAGDAPAMSECNRLKDECDAAISDPYPAGSFTSKGTTNVIADIEEFLITTVDADGQTIDWLNTAEEGDYLEFFDTTDGDTALFEVVDEPATANTEQTIRVKFISQTGAGDGNFNLQQSYDIRVFKVAQGIDLSEADARYVLKPVVNEALSDIEALKAKPDITSSTTAPTDPKQGDLWFNPSTLKFAFYTSGAWINPDQS